MNVANIGGPAISWQKVGGNHVINLAIDSTSGEANSIYRLERMRIADYAFQKIDEGGIVGHNR